MNRDGCRCNEACAKKECEDAGAKPGESWYWKAENYSQHPYECYNKTVVAGWRRRPSIADIMARGL